MRNKVFRGLALFFVGFLASCSGAEEKALESLQAEVLDLHDALMPKTERIFQLNARLDSLAVISKDTTELHQLRLALKKADAAMMDWMHDFSMDSLKQMPLPQARQYLMGEMQKLKSIERLSDSSLNAAQKYLP